MKLHHEIVAAVRANERADLQRGLQRFRETHTEPAQIHVPQRVDQQRIVRHIHQHLRPASPQFAHLRRRRSFRELHDHVSARRGFQTARLPLHDLRIFRQRHLVTRLRAGYMH
jgi:hypothetical protein